MPKNPRIDDDDLDVLDIDNNQNADDQKIKNYDNINENENKDNDPNSNSNDTDEYLSRSINKSKKKNKLTKTDNRIHSKDNSNKVEIQSNEITGEQPTGSTDSIEKSSLISGDEDAFDSKFFVIRVSGGQESYIASMLQSRLTSKNINGIYSILFLDNFKGYVIVEAIDSNVVYEAFHGVRHLRGQIRGELPFKDLEGYLIKKPVVTELNIDDTVEIIAGPFKSMKAKIMRVDYEKHEATLVLLDSPYQIPVTVDANYLKKSL